MLYKIEIRNWGTGCHIETTEGGKVIWNWRSFGVETFHIFCNIVKHRIDQIKGRPLVTKSSKFLVYGLLDILCSYVFLFTLVEATSRSGIMWPVKIGMESTEKWLDGHNRRRRKPQPSSLFMAAEKFMYNYKGRFVSR